MPDAASHAKGALRRLAQARLEPTPANYARAYAEESGEPIPAPPAPSAAAAAPDGATWAALIERVARGLERGSKAWTPARRKDSLQRVLDGSRSDAQRLQQRLTQLMTAWSEGGDDPTVEVTDTAAPDARAAGATSSPGDTTAAVSTDAAPAGAGRWPDVTQSLTVAVQEALPPTEWRARELADQLGALAARLASEGATPELAAEVEAACQRARRLLAYRHRLIDDLSALARSFTEGLVELAEDRSWAQGQAEALRQRLAPADDDASEAGDGADAGEAALTARQVRAAAELLQATRDRQRTLRDDRERAREALKLAIGRLLAELGELDAATGRFSDSMGRYADVIEQADSLESLAGVVREIVGESRAVHGLVSGARERLTSEHARALELEAKVRELETELRRLSDEVATDALTQIANRRGMMQAFEAERARYERDANDGAAALCIGLLDIDNFKKLNDTLGHAAGDEALKGLAARVKNSLRPGDHVARYGGEEFVVLLPATAVDEAQQVLTRLQREMTAALFMHEGRDVFVTFSAGVTAYRSGERIEAALERADEGLYEAKRTGKNRTCIA